MCTDKPQPPGYSSSREECSIIDEDPDQELLFWLKDETGIYDEDIESCLSQISRDCNANSVYECAVAEGLKNEEYLIYNDYSYSNNIEYIHYAEELSESPPICEPLQRRGPGRPRANVNVFPHRSSGRKVCKVWEFLRNLLQDERTCPSLIRWQDYDRGMFKFVKSDQVAKLWGSRKNNGQMNYEKLSRAMRYYYKSKVLLPVPGKRLVYQFGPNATGWRTNNPILN